MAYDGSLGLASPNAVQCGRVYIFRIFVFAKFDSTSLPLFLSLDISVVGELPAATGYSEKWQARRPSC
jgi:hypothetical protein